MYKLLKSIYVTVAFFSISYCLVIDFQISNEHGPELCIHTVTLVSLATKDKFRCRIHSVLVALLVMLFI